NIEEILDYVEEGDFTDYIERVEIDFNDSDVVDEFMSNIDEMYGSYYSNNLLLPFALAEHYYSIDQLIDAYKKKMKRNHERQDGTADAGKGYV
ncbi:TPA: dUTPase, partial [Staphylococcus aureus]|nr:dUTPase [Staphylococcus aureus]